MKSSRFMLAILAVSLAANVGLFLRSTNNDRLTSENAGIRADLARVQAEFSAYRITAAAENKRVVDEANAALTAAADKVVKDFVGK